MQILAPTKVLVEGEDFGGFEAEVMNFSPNGVFVHSGRRLRVGSPVKLVFLCPDLQKLSSRGSVVVSGDRFLGFVVLEGSESLQDALTEWAGQQSAAFAALFPSVPPEDRPPQDSIPPVPASLPPELGWLQKGGPYVARSVLPPLPVMDPREIVDFLERESPVRASIPPLNPGLPPREDMSPESSTEPDLLRFVEKRPIPANLVDDLELE